MVVNLTLLAVGVVIACMGSFPWVRLRWKLIRNPVAAVSPSPLVVGYLNPKVEALNIKNSGCEVRGFAAFENKEQATDYLLK